MSVVINTMEKLIPIKPISSMRRSAYQLYYQPFPLLDEDFSRLGHVVRNIGTSEVTVRYGLGESEDRFGTRPEMYSMLMLPGDAYLYDIPEVIPFQAIARDPAAELEIIEFF